MAVSKYLDNILNMAEKGLAKASKIDLDTIAKNTKNTVKKGINDIKISNAVNKSVPKHQLFQTRIDNVSAKIASEKATMRDVRSFIGNDIKGGVIKDITSDGIGEAYRARMAYASTTGKDAAKIALRPYKRVEPSIKNAYTGYRIKPGVETGLAMGVVAFGAGIGAVKGGVMYRRKYPQSEQAGTLPGLSYDGVPNATDGRRDLGATGELVFGLHNARKG